MSVTQKRAAGIVSTCAAAVLCFLYDAAGYASGSAEPEVSKPGAASAPASGSVTGSELKAEGSTQSTLAAKIQSLLDAKRFSEALKEVEIALKGEPKNALFLKQKGFALREHGKFKEAITAYIDALKIDPNLNEAKEYLAVTYLKMGEIKPAAQLYKELLQADPALAKMLRAEAEKLNVKF